VISGDRGLRVVRAFSAWLGTLTAIALVACAHETSKAVSTTYQPAVSVIVASPRPLYRSYPVSAAFKSHGPPLTREQRAWIAKIVHSHNYGWERSKLRFALVVDYHVPIVVYRAHMYQGNDHGGLIIGESCASLFDPYEFGFVTTPGDVSCDETSKPVK
jgi:hypothetical protein